MIKRGQYVKVIKGFYTGDTGVIEQYIEGFKYWVDYGKYDGNWFYEHELERIDPPTPPVSETWWERLCKLWPFY